MPPDGQTAPHARPATARVFFALWPPAAIVELLAGTARSAASQFGGKATRPASIHLTLAFLGEVAESSLPRLVETAAGVRAAPFALQLDTLGYWPHNHLLWAGCSAPPPELLGLATALKQQLGAAGFAVADAGRHFAAHLTLLRKIPAAQAPQKLPAIAPLAWPCTGFVLVGSQLSASGPEYKILAEFPLVP